MAFTDQVKSAAYRAVKSHPAVRWVAVRLLDAYFRLRHATGTITGGRSVSPPDLAAPSTKDWVSSEEGRKLGAQIELIHPRKTLEQPPPKSVDDETHWKFLLEPNRITAETFVSVIPGGRVWGEGQVISPDNVLLGDVSVEFKAGGKYIDSPESHPIFRESRLPRPTRLKGSVAVLSVPGGRGYYHWLCDLLPRFDLIRQSKTLRVAPDAYLINSIVADFHREALQALGIGKSLTVESLWHPHVEADALIVPSLTDHPGRMPDWAMDFLRRTFSPATGYSAGSPKRIYVSRSNATHRKVTNEEELFALLSRRGFVMIEMERISLREKAALLSGIEMIVSPHGAGLTNIAFCRSGCKVIELFSPNAVNRVYWRMSRAAGLDYYYVIGEGDRPPPGVDPQANEEDMLIDLGKLSATLDLAEVS